MHALAELSPQAQKPRQARMGGLRHASLHIEMKDRLCAGAKLCQSPPTRIAEAQCSTPTADEFDSHRIAVCGPVVMKVFEKCRPRVRDAMSFEVAKRKGKRMVYPDKGRRSLMEFGCQPLGNPPPGPLLAATGRRADLSWWLCGRGGINAQALQAGGGSCRPRVVDADVALELGHAATREDRQLNSASR